MSPRRIGLSAGAIVASAMLIAGQASEGRAELSYDVSLGAGAVLNDNFHLDPPVAGETEEGVEPPREPVQETTFTIIPGLRLAWGAGHDRLSLWYSGEYSMYEGDEERDQQWTHDIAADLNWRRWSPLYFELKDDLSRVPRTQDVENEAYVDQIDRNLLLVRTGLVYEFDARSVVELGYRGELDSYSVSGGDESGEPESASGTDEFDRVKRQYVEALARRRWSPLWGGEVRVKFGEVDRELSSDYLDLRVSVAVDQRWSEHVALRYGLEWVREEHDEAAGEGTTGEPATDDAADPVISDVLLGFSVRGELERGGSWSLAYQDYLTSQSDGDTLATGRASAAAVVRARLGSALDVEGWHETRDYRESGREEVAWGPRAGVRWLIAPWAALDVRGSWTRTTIQEEGLPEVEDTTVRAAAGIVLLALKRLQLDLGYGYRKNDSTDTLRSYTNNLLFAVMTYHFTPIESGRLPVSFASRVVAGGALPGGE